MIKLVMVLLFISANIHAFNSNILSKNIEQSSKQRTLKTIKDYNDFIIDMKKALDYGKYEVSIALGVLYMKDVKLDDGIKKADLHLSEKYLKIGLKNKKYIAAFYLSMIKNKHESILLLQNTIHNTDAASYIKTLLATRYAEIILIDNELSKNLRIVKIAIKDIEPIAYSSDNSTLDFSLAHLYYINKEIAKANKFINSACNHPKANAQLLNLCLNNPYLKNNTIGQ